MTRAASVAAACLAALCLTVTAGCTTCTDSVCGDGNGRNALGGGDVGNGEPDGLPEGFTGGGDRATSAPEPGKVRFSDDVLLNEEIDLDTDPPGPPSTDTSLMSGTDLYFYSLVNAGINPLGTTAEWKGERWPRREQCEDVLSRFALQSYEWSEVGSSFCLRTSEGRTAFVHLRSKDDRGYLLGVTVWEK